MNHNVNATYWKDERTEKEGWDCYTWATEQAELTHVLDRDVGVLSGGELQRFAIAAVAVAAVRRYLKCRRSGRK